ncbi:molybdopterin-dependent oxidoreductase [Dehalobacter sp. DCM]|uniref:molybdopterin-dependent oxidoreductase n=1 Tax=Dehalobacter sp. DCM TaxID=2907827 RepID=UPI00308161B3|nr:molybdopterin-dependent oxidoreductase [Dehalobacter sp. DCM]
MNKPDGLKTYYKGLGFCGGACGSNTTEVDVKDGKIVRIRPMHYDRLYTPEQMNAWTLNARGKSYKPSMKSQIPPFSLVYKNRAYSNNRIPYPLKREDWDPNGERNPQNRGKSKFVRISWDEALDIIVSELKRVHKEYGPYSVLGQVDGHGETKAVHGPHGCQTELLKLLGGYTYQGRQPDSWEGWHWGAKHMWGQAPLGQANQYNLWYDVSHHTDTLLFWGCDMETTPWAWGGQQSSRLCFWLSEIGIKQVYICPDVNYGCAVHADKWIPVFPNTDSALHLAIMYTWLKENLWDKEYVQTHADGYEIFFKYVLGEEDGIPKTPDWAEPICGVPARIIKALARKWAKDRTTLCHCNGGSYIRSTYSHEPARLEVLAVTMQGIGKPGRNVLKFIEWQMFGLNSAMPGPRSEIIPHLGGAYHGWMMGLVESFIPKTLMPQALSGNYTAENPLKWYSFPDAGFPAEQQFIEYQYPIPGANPIRMIWSDAPCWTTCWNGGNAMIEAYRSPNIEFIVTQHPWLENDCLFADLLLPVNTKFEETDISVDICGGDFNLIYREDQCIDTIGESMSDWEIACAVAKRFGPDIYEKFTEGLDVEGFIRRGFEQSGVHNYLSYDEFNEKKYFVVPIAKDWEKDQCGFEAFYKDPENNPLETSTGKVHFYSEELAHYFPDDQERPPYPKFIPYGETHQESRLHPRSETYPYLIVSNHPRWRCHAQLDDIQWLREIPTCKVKGPDGYLYEPVWINPLDAEKIGVKNGDVVKVINDRGWVLGGVYVTERIKPGVVLQDHGARLDPIEAGVSDRGGANNLICPTNTTSKNAVGEVTSGFLVNIEKCDVFALAKEYPETFGREFDARGVCLTNWIKEGE